MFLLTTSSQCFSTFPLFILWGLLLACLFLLLFCLVLFFKSGYHYVAQSGLDFIIPLPQPRLPWDYGPVHLSVEISFSFFFFLLSVEAYGLLNL